METVIAAGIIRTAADALRAGSDVETALRESSKGAPRHVLELVLERLRRATPARIKIAPGVIARALLTAESELG
jgi:hypothetical protein